MAQFLKNIYFSVLFCLIEEKQNETAIPDLYGDGVRWNTDALPRLRKYSEE